MQRRTFLKSALTASVASAASAGTALAQPSGGREYYQLRKYHLSRGTGSAMTEKYFRDALIPTLNRMGMKTIGAFSVNYGPETPTYYLLIPSSDLFTLTNLDLLLAKDETFLKAAEPFWSSPGKDASPFVDAESSLLAAFDGWPHLTAPDTKQKRIFHLRTYVSSTYGDHVRKVEMFHHGEFKIFQESGCGQVFYGDLLIGRQLPSLTYMLTFPDLAALEKGWAGFLSHPEWKKLAADPRYAFEPIVTNIDSLILNPLPFSQV